MPIKVTQALIDQAYDMLKNLLKTKNITSITRDTLESVIASAIVVTLELLTAKTQHIYLVELATMIVRKLIDDSDLTAPEHRVMLHMLLEATILVMLPKINCFWPTSCACSK